MKTTRLMIFLLTAIVAGILMMDLLTLRSMHPMYMSRQLHCIGLGVCLCLALFALGERRLSRYGCLATVATLTICWICTPSASLCQWLPPACVLGLASVRHHKGDGLALALTALLSFLATTAPCAAVGGSLSCLSIGLLYGYTVRSRKHRKFRWALAILLGLAPFCFRTLSVLSCTDGRLSLDSLTWLGAELIRRDLAAASWFGPTTGLAPASPFYPPWIGMLENVALHCGKAALIAVLVLWTGLSTCLIVATRRCATPTSRILILGGSIILIMNMSASVVKLFANLTYVQYLQPFLTPGMSASVASFLSLGLVIVGLTTPRDRHQARCRNKGNSAAFCLSS